MATVAPAKTSDLRQSINTRWATIKDDEAALAQEIDWQ
jgi:hypothetical protein